MMQPKRALLLLMALILVACSPTSTKPIRWPAPVEPVVPVEPLRLSILGDSYSTFEGYVRPDSNYCWYGPSHEQQNDVKRVTECWWHLLLENHNLRLEQNNSFSGATICHTGYNGEDYADRSFLTRMTNLGNPQLILLFGGTNDSWADVPLGELKYEGWSSEELYQFRPAFCALLDGLRRLYPEACICNIVNTELKPEIGASMAEACRHYGVENIPLRDIDKQWGHPSVKGMAAIAEQVATALALE